MVPEFEEATREYHNYEAMNLDLLNEANENNLETKLAEEVRLRLFTEAVLDARQQELESHEMEKNQLAQQLEEAKKELADTQRQLTDARALLKGKNKQLQEAKDQIFHLQPSRKDITETEAQDEYKCLCNNVQRWVENRLRPILDDLDCGQLRGRPMPNTAARFVTLMREPAKKCLDADQSDEYHVMAVIMNYLSMSLFSKPFYSPLDDTESGATVQWIDELETIMSASRDISHCRDWRCETLTAMTNHPGFKARRTRYIQAISEDLASVLSDLVPRSSPEEIQTSICRTIIEPAADLAHQLHLATNIYSVKWPARTAASRLEVYECLNLASDGLILNLSGTTHASPSRQQVSYLFDVAPGLFTERVEGGKKISLKVICRPTVLVYDAEGEPAQRLTVVRWLWDHSGAASQAPSRTATPKKSSLAPSSAGRRR